MPVFFKKTHPAPTFSVIIPSRDGVAAGNVERLLQSLEHQSRIDEAEILLVVGERPNGHARNVGVDASRGRFLIFIDDDAVLHGRTVLPALVAPFETPPADDERPVGMTGSATMLPPDANRFQRRVARAMPRSVFPAVDRVTETDMAHHLCCAVPRAVYEAVGRESDTLETGTDVDLRNRLRAAGRRIVVVPHTVAEHPPPASLGAFLRKHFWYGLGKVELDQLYPPTGGDVIGGGPGAAVSYVLKALLTAPLRVIKFDRTTRWSCNPLRALADLARKLGYARAWWMARLGLPPTSRLLSSRTWGQVWSGARTVTVAAPAPAAVSRVLVVATAGLGDTVQMLPLFDALRRHFPHSRITAWVSHAGAADVLRLQSEVDAIEVRRLSAAGAAGRLRRKLATLIWLRRCRFDLALVNFINSTDDVALLLAAAGIPVRAGFTADPGAPSLFNIRVPLEPFAGGRPAVDRHLDLLPAVNAELPDDTTPRWRVGHDAAQVAKARWPAATSKNDAAARWVALHPGGGGGMAWKRWPVERFAELADRLARRGLSILVIGGPDESALVAEVRHAMSEPSTDLDGLTGLDETAAVLARCRLLVGNDTGLIHLAVAAGVSVVAVFGPTPPELHRPRGTSAATARVVDEPVACRPCYDPRRPPVALGCPVAWRCLQAITVARVEDACLEVLESAAIPAAVPTASPAAGEVERSP